MSLQECMRRHTHREYIVWLEWLSMQLDVPDRIEHYLAQIACEVRRSYVKNSRGVKHKHFLLRFVRSGEEQRSTPEESKAFWIGGVGKEGVRQETISREEADRRKTATGDEYRRFLKSL